MPYLNNENLQVFLLRYCRRHEYPFLPVLFDIVLEILTIPVGKKNIKCIHIGNKVKLSVFVGNAITKFRIP